MRKDGRVPRSEPGRLHWSDALWLAILPVVYLFWLWAGIAAAVMGGIVSAFVVIGIRNWLYSRREEQQHHRRLDEGFWNH